MRLPGTLRLVCSVTGNTVSVLEAKDGALRTLITYTDPMGLVCGRAGIDASGDGMGFDRVFVGPAEQ